MSTGNLCITLFVCLFCVAFLTVPMFIIYRCIDSIANDRKHWANWNKTVHSVDYDCPIDHITVCCDCNIFKFGHCCQKRTARDTFSSSERICMRNYCEPENDQKWFNLVGIVLCILFQLMALTCVLCVVVNSCKVGSCSRCCRRLFGIHDPEERREEAMDQHRAQHSMTDYPQRPDGIHVIDLDAIVQNSTTFNDPPPSYRDVAVLHGDQAIPHKQSMPSERRCASGSISSFESETETKNQNVNGAVNT